MKIFILGSEADDIDAWGYELGTTLTERIGEDLERLFAGEIKTPIPFMPEKN